VRMLTGRDGCVHPKPGPMSAQEHTLTRHRFEIPDLVVRRGCPPNIQRNGGDPVTFPRRQPCSFVKERLRHAPKKGGAAQAKGSLAQLFRLSSPKKAPREMANPPGCRCRSHTTLTPGWAQRRPNPTPWRVTAHGCRRRYVGIVRPQGR